MPDFPERWRGKSEKNESEWEGNQWMNFRWPPNDLTPSTTPSGPRKAWGTPTASQRWSAMPLCVLYGGVTHAEYAGSTTSCLRLLFANDKRALGRAKAPEPKANWSRPHGPPCIQFSQSIMRQPNLRENAKAPDFVTALSQSAGADH